MPEYEINGKTYLITREYENNGTSILDGVIDYLIDLSEEDDKENNVKEE